MARAGSVAESEEWEVHRAWTQSGSAPAPALAAGVAVPSSAWLRAKLLEEGEEQELVAPRAYCSDEAEAEGPHELDWKFPMRMMTVALEVVGVLHVPAQRAVVGLYEPEGPALPSCEQEPQGPDAKLVRETLCEGVEEVVLEIIRHSGDLEGRIDAVEWARLTRAIQEEV